MKYYGEIKDWTSQELSHIMRMHRACSQKRDNGECDGNPFHCEGCRFVDAEHEYKMLDPMLRSRMNEKIEQLDLLEEQSRSYSVYKHKKAISCFIFIGFCIFFLLFGSLNILHGQESIKDILPYTAEDEGFNIYERAVAKTASLTFRAINDNIDANGDGLYNRYDYTLLFCYFYNRTQTIGRMIPVAAFCKEDVKGLYNDTLLALWELPGNTIKLLEPQGWAVYQFCISCGSLITLFEVMDAYEFWDTTMSIGRMESHEELLDYYFKNREEELSDYYFTGR